MKITNSLEIAIMLRNVEDKKKKRANNKVVRYSHRYYEHDTAKT